ncbi:hypothetical protein GQ43DRAFT_314154 [Delitschia confertaspora ATCC 74209]|uniref:Uncharacterized protein n=1 Tax=Delitschia confertaspora ATCC 74209 TaxID=1513339 RepID=A0A9P4JS93_9PLEO|nr:hypothetical protein GQ43DRAFT_314154 [Delitschia confertaspora ATCC 74209]
MFISNISNYMMPFGQSIFMQSCQVMDHNLTKLPWALFPLSSFSLWSANYLLFSALLIVPLVFTYIHIHNQYLVKGSFWSKGYLGIEK